MYKYIPIDAPSNMVFIGGGISDENKTFIYIILFIVIVFVLYNIWQSYSSLVNKVQTQEQKLLQVHQSQQEQVQQDPKKQNVSVNVSKPELQVPPVNPWREYDYRTLRDPLVAPRRRDDYNLPVLPIPTRGYPAAFKKMGLLIDKKAGDNDRYKILLLMGRNKHPNSTVYDYYAAENLPDSAIKFNMDITRELQTDDIVKIPELNRTYRVVMDKVLGYEYDPYIY